MLQIFYLPQFNYEKPSTSSHHIARIPINYMHGYQALATCMEALEVERDGKTLFAYVRYRISCCNNNEIIRRRNVYDPLRLFSPLVSEVKVAIWQILIHKMFIHSVMNLKRFLVVRSEFSIILA